MKTTTKQLLARKKRLEQKLSVVTKEIEKRTIVGYRAIMYGDNYCYGSYANYLFENFLSRKQAKLRAQAIIDSCSNGGHVEDIYKGQEIPTHRIH